MNMSTVVDRLRLTRGGGRRRALHLVRVACALLALTLTASYGSADAKTQIIINLTSEMDGFAPHQNTGPEMYAFFRHIYDPMVNANRSEYTPGIACSWERPDPTTWRFHMCPEARFSDGSPVTAEDVVFTFDLLANDETSLQIGSVEAVKSVTAVDEHTVDFTSEAPDAMFLGALGDRAIQSKAYYDRLGKEAAIKQPMGSGPYRVVEIRPGERYVLEKRDDYWARDVLPDMHPTYTKGTAPDLVIYRFIREPEAQVTALLNGELDVITDVPTQFLDRLEQGGAHVGANKQVQHLFFAMNPITDAMSNRNVRLAIAHAIDVQALIDGPLRGAAYKLNGPIADDLPTYTDDLPKHDFDPEKARALLAEAGYPDGLDINMKCPTGEWLAEQEICQATQAMLADVGIRADLKFVEWTTYSSEYRKAAEPERQYEFFLTGARPPGADPGFYDNWFECGGRTAYCNQAIADGFDEANAMMDDGERENRYHQIWAALMEDAPAVFLWQYKVNYATSAKVTGDPLQDGPLLATTLEVSGD